MPRTLSIKSRCFAPLAALPHLAQDQSGYFRVQRTSADPYVSAGAWLALLDQRLESQTLWPELLRACRHGAVRAKAFEAAEAASERKLQQEIAAVPVAAVDDLRRRKMLAELAFDAGGGAVASGEMYLATGQLPYLLEASLSAEAGSGWQSALEWAVRQVAIAPLDLQGLGRTYYILQGAAQADLLVELADIMTRAGIYPQIATLLVAAGSLQRGDRTAYLSKLNLLTDERVSRDRVLSPMLQQVRMLRASAYEKSGDFRAAYETYRTIHATDGVTDAAHAFYRRAADLDKLDVRRPASISSGNTVQMLGFPRSGTTLLENVLATHPDIETFEEIPALAAALAELRDVLDERTPDPAALDRAVGQARATYARQIETRRQKPAASILIDKMPIRSCDAPFLKKLFPEWRYIFSIRHPFDVVLSCLKQRFKPNPAMENFRSFESAVRLYDFTMTRWFGSFSLDDRDVCYVRYDDLVTDFEATIRRVLAFLDKPWDDAVLDFATAANRRAARTPSYRKVRQGLSLGVQTYWRDYAFLFESRQADPLRKWATHFGYEIDEKVTS